MVYTFIPLVLCSFGHAKIHLRNGYFHGKYDAVIVWGYRTQFNAKINGKFWKFGTRSIFLVMWSCRLSDWSFYKCQVFMVYPWSLHLIAFSVC